MPPPMGIPIGIPMAMDGGIDGGIVEGVELVAEGIVNLATDPLVLPGWD